MATVETVQKGIAFLPCGNWMWQEDEGATKAQYLKSMHDKIYMLESMHLATVSSIPSKPTSLRGNYHFTQIGKAGTHGQ